MKRVILIGVAILFATSMVMAVGYDVPPDPAAIADGTYDYLNIGISADASASASGSVTITGDTNIGDAGYTGSLAVSGSIDLQAGAYVGVNGGVSAGTGSITVDAGGSVTAGGAVYLGYDAASTAGGTGSADISGSLDITGILSIGGYTYASGSCSMDVQASGSVTSSNSLYVGGQAGGSGSHSLTIDGAASVSCGNDINVGWADGGGLYASGHLYIEGSGGGSISATRHIALKRGYFHYEVDAGGVTPIVANGDGNIIIFGGVVPETAKIDMSFDSPATQALYDAMGAMDPGRWVVLADASIGVGTLNWGQPGDLSYSGAMLLGDPKWELVERTTDVLEAHYMVPEPTTMALLGLGGLLVALRRRS